MMRGALSAQQRHRAQALYGFHSDPPMIFSAFFSSYFLFSRQWHHHYIKQLFLGCSER
jgi:hypothetical protein